MTRDGPAGQYTIRYHTNALYIHILFQRSTVLVCEFVDTYFYFIFSVTEPNGSAYKITNTANKNRKKNVSMS